MMAAAAAGNRDLKVTLIEKNEKLGKKLYITGKGRCNLTNECDNETFLKNVVRNPKFMYSCVSAFDPHACMEWFADNGLKLKTERGNRVFPASDRSSDVIKTLERAITLTKAEVKLGTLVKNIVVKEPEEGSGPAVSGVRLMNGDILTADYVCVATGGSSYPSTGSTGDGYRFARETGHNVTDTYPSLAAVKVSEGFVKRLEGLSLKNIVLSAYDDHKRVYKELGEMLFTADGISGPLVLTLSALMTSQLSSGSLKIYIDLKPGLDEEMLDARLLRDFDEGRNRYFANALDKLLPSSIIPVIIELSGIDGKRKVNSITKEERRKLITLLKSFELTSKGIAGYNEAVITRGGVDIRQVNPKTMESKLVKGLFFAGEVLDVDALTGGFNLQIAWSTAQAAIQAILKDVDG